MRASDTTPAKGESADGRTDTESHARRFWACTFCGNLIARRTVPSKCYNCRRGETEKSRGELYEEIVLGEIAQDLVGGLDE